MHSHAHVCRLVMVCHRASLSYSSYSVTQAQLDQKLDCALDLMRRLPPQQIEKNLSDLIDLVREIRGKE